MVKKILLLSPVLLVLMFSTMPRVCFADAATQFKQAETYKKNKQYDQAEQIYQQILINFPDSNDALEAQKQLTLIYIATDRQAQAETAFGELTAGFSQHKDIAEAILRVGRAYTKAKKFNKAEEAHQYNVGHFPADKYAMWSQVEIFHSHVRKGDNAAADAAVDKLLSVFASQPTLPKEIHQIANKYSKARRREKAMELRKYNVARFPKDKYAMWSQVEIVYAHIRDPNAADAAVNAEVDRLLNAFSDQPTLPKEVRQVANMYKNRAKRAEKAIELHTYNVDNFPKNLHAMGSQIDIVKFYIGDGNDAAAADAAVNKLINVFSEQETLAKEINEIAKRYRRAGRAEKAMELRKYNVEHYPKSKYAMWSQVEIISAHIKDANDTAADAATADLLTVFSHQPTLPKEIRKIANTFKNKAKRAEKAIELHRHNVDNFPDNSDAMGSQLDVVNYYIADANDANAAEAAAGKLLNVFSDQPGFAKEVYEVASKFKEAGWAEKAVPLYQYNVDYFPEDANALLSQVEIVYFHIKQKDDAVIDAAVEKLLGTFSEQPTLPRKIRDVGRRLYWKGKREKALELHRYNVEHYPDDKYAMWSQVEIAYAHIRDPNAADAAVNAEVDRLLGAFSEQSSLPKEIRQVANRYNKAGNREKALQLHKYNIDNFPADANAMWSQVDIFETHLADPNGSTAADAAVQKLLGVFSDNPKLPKAIRSVAKKYNASGRSDKAMELWMRNVDNSPNNVNAMLSQMDIIYSYIDPNDGNDAAVDAAVDKLLTVFADQPTLPEKVHQIGNKYRDSGKYERAIQFYQLAAERWPQDKIAITSRVAIGKVHIELGDDEAVQAIIDGLIADYNDHPDLPKAVFVVGEEYYYKAFDDPNKCLKVKSEEYLYKAKDIWERIVPQRPESQSIDLKHAYYFSAVCYHRLREYERAIEYYQKVVDDWPDYLYAWSAQYLIGNCYEKLRNSGVIPESEANPKIEQAYEAVVEKYPDSGSVNNALLKLGWFNFKKGQWVDAAMYFELFMEKAPEDQRRTGVLYDLGRAYEEMGELDVAVQVYSAFIKIAEPTDPRIKRVEAWLEELGGNNK